ncbi:MAG TPA: hypothetical protein VFB37_07455 [Steroidobacteraceae bacterium]|nr:hypothetical protein [Steroidobacteraceae bacterium]
MDTQENTGGVNSYMGILRRRRVYVGTIAPLITFAAIYLAFTLPPEYQSTATILIEPSVVNKDVVAPTVASYSNQQIEIVEGRVLKLDTLKALVKSYDPYPEDKTMDLTQKAQRVLQSTTLERVDPVTMKPDQDANAFSLHYNNPDPERASETAKRLAQAFLTYNQRSREQAAQDATLFLKQQAEAVSQQMREIDEEINKFKNAHGDALPEDMARNEAAIDRDQHDLDSLQQEILRVQEKEGLLSVELSQISPNMISQAGDLTDVATVRTKLAEAEQRYTPDHPEVKRLKRALQDLMAAQGTATKGGIVSNANNPQYLSTASELQSARKELDSLHGQADRLRGEINKYEELLRRTPGVEREYSDITRRRQSAQTAYAQIQDKLQHAQLAESFESEEQGEKFVLLRAPIPAKLPVYPNRIGLILLGFILGGALAAIAVAIAESADSTVRSVRDFPEAEDAPILASIPQIDNSSDRRRNRLRFATWVAAYTAAVLVIGVAVVSGLKSTTTTPVAQTQAQ